MATIEQNGFSEDEKGKKAKVIYDRDADKLFQEGWGRVSHRSQPNTPIRGHAESQSLRSTQGGRRLK